MFALLFVLFLVSVYATTSLFAVRMAKRGGKNGAPGIGKSQRAAWAHEKEKKELRPAADTMRPVGFVAEEDVFLTLGIVPGVREQSRITNSGASSVAMCEVVGKKPFSSRFVQANHRPEIDLAKDAFKYRNTLFTTAAVMRVNVSICSVEPPGSILATAADAADALFDSGAAKALADDWSQLIYDNIVMHGEAVGAESAEYVADRAKPFSQRQLHGWHGGVTFYRRETQGSRDTDCRVVVMPLPPAVADKDRIPCRTYSHYDTSQAANGGGDGGGAAFGGASATHETESQRNDRVVSNGEYELTVTPTQLLVRARHMDGLRHALTTTLQMALHTASLEVSGRAIDRTVVDKFRASRQRVGGKSGKRPLKLDKDAAQVQQLLAKARGEKKPLLLSIPTVWIGDGPASGWRGLQLDVARHFHTVSTVKNVLRAMARRKLNRLQLHLTDDQGWRLESALFPALAKLGGKRGPALNGVAGLKHSKSREYKTAQFYTAQEVRQLSDFAAARGIALVPEIDMPAHAAAAVIALQRDVGRLNKLSFAERFGKTRRTATHFKPRDFAVLDLSASDRTAAMTFDAAVESLGLSSNKRRAVALETLMLNTVVPALDQLRARRSAPAAEQEYEEPHYIWGFVRKTNDDCNAFPMAEPIAHDNSGAPNCMGGTHGVLLPDDDGLLLAKAVLAEVAAVFDRSEYLHIGGDQAAGIRDVGWERFTHADPPKYMAATRGTTQGGRLTTNDLQAAFMDALIVFVRDDLQRHPIVWDDTLLENGNKYTVPEGTIVAFWREDAASWNEIEEHAARIKRAGSAGAAAKATTGAHRTSTAASPLPVVFMGKTRLYFDYVQYLPASANRGYPNSQLPPPWAKHKAVTFKRAYDARLAVPPKASWRHVSVIGFQACLWSELLWDDAALTYNLFPRLYALSDVAWAGQRQGSVEVAGLQSSDSTPNEGGTLCVVGEVSAGAECTGVVARLTLSEPVAAGMKRRAPPNAGVAETSSHDFRAIALLDFVTRGHHHDVSSTATSPANAVVTKDEPFSE
jgi:hypothetical protein